MQCILILVFILFVIGCGNANNKEDAVYKVLSEDIQNTTSIFNQNNGRLYQYFDYNLKDPKARDKIIVLLPALEKIHRSSDNIVQQINSMKAKIFSEEKAGNIINTNLLPLKNLYDSLVNFQTKMLDRDPMFLAEFRHMVLVSNFHTDTLQQPFSDFQQVFFSAKSNYAYISLLSTLENRIRLLENKMLEFEDKRITHLGGCFDGRYLPLLTQDKRIVSANDTVQIIAVSCDAINQDKLSMTVDGSSVKPNENGFMIYKLIAKNTKGKQNVLVAIDFIDTSTGQPITISKIINYTVR